MPKTVSIDDLPDEISIDDLPDSPKEKKESLGKKVFDFAKAGIPGLALADKAFGGDIGRFAEDPSLEKLKTLGDDSPLASVISGVTKAGYLGFDDSIVGALGGEEEKKKYKKKQEGLEAANPGSFLTGEIAGGFATPVIGAGLVKGASTAAPSLAAKLSQMSPQALKAFAAKNPRLAATLANMGIGGAEGAALGAGYSEEGDVSGDASLGAGIGIAVPGAIGAVGKIASKSPGLKKITQMISGLNDTEFDVAATRDLRTAKTSDQMEGVYQDVLDKLKQNTVESGKKVSAAMGKYDDLADLPGVGRPASQSDSFGIMMPNDPIAGAKDITGKIAPEGTFSVDELASFTNDFITKNLMNWRPKTQSFQFKNKEAEKAANKILSEQDSLASGMYDFIPEDRVDGFLKNLTDSVNYEKDAKSSIKPIKDYAASFKEMWYGKNPALKEAKFEAGQAMALENRGQKLLSPDKEFVGNKSQLLPSDRSRLFEQRLLKDETFSSKRFSDRLKEATGIDIYDDAIKRSVKESTKGGADTGFWDRVALQKIAGIGAAGASIGAYSGDPQDAFTGGGIGLGAGILRSLYGKRLGRDMLQYRLKQNPNNKFAQAAKGTPEQQKKLASEYLTKGDKGMASALYVLSTRDQRFRERSKDGDAD